MCRCKTEAKRSMGRENNWQWGTNRTIKNGLGRKTAFYDLEYLQDLVHCGSERSPTLSYATRMHGNSWMRRRFAYYLTISVFAQHKVLVQWTNLVCRIPLMVFHVYLSRKTASNKIKKHEVITRKITYY